MPTFISTAILKRDIFSETHKGHFAGNPQEQVIRRIVTATPWWSRPVAWWLAHREIRALEAVEGIAGTTELLSVDEDGIFRRWAEGTPLQLARPADPHWYRDARRLILEMHRRGVTHNDIAKPQNWLVLPDGSAGIIDFQLAVLHKRRGRLFRIMAYEDRRHLIKQKRAFAPGLLTPREIDMLGRRSLPSRIWLATFKPVYNFITRGLLRWSDGEGTRDRMDIESPGINSAFMQHPAVTDVALAVFPLPRKGVGLYAFVEAPEGVDPLELERLQRIRMSRGGADLIQPVSRLPRHKDGSPRDDILRLIAMNQMTELESLVGNDPAMAALTKEIASERLNFTDRRLSQQEKAGR
ncbi:MAG: serine/threonine protein kinase [Phyllobacteriaceae bacterium]|nr:serine/threonine protein kinase [Phyllobacteriaceae bacterium]MBA91174.1 serine/threonine protein kinase [Phyllobacteriaceae bacterium]